MTENDRIESVEELYEKLRKYIHWLAYRANRKQDLHILLQPDDLAGELFCELVYVWRHYEDRDDLDADTMIRIVKVSLDNRIRELICAYHWTHRKQEYHNVSLEHAFPDDSQDADPGETIHQWTPGWTPIDEYTVPDPQELIESNSRIAKFLRCLTAPEREIVEAILCMDERVARQARLVGTRKAFVYKTGGTVTMNFNLVADALHMDRKECQLLWRSIRHKWRDHERSW